MKIDSTLTDLDFVMSFFRLKPSFKGVNENIGHMTYDNTDADTLLHVLVRVISPFRNTKKEGSTIVLPV